MRPLSGCPVGDLPAMGLRDTCPCAECRDPRSGQELFAGAGGTAYPGEPVSMAQHMPRAGALAEAAGAGPHLVAAALLHDVGHVEGDVVTGRALMTGTDNRHSRTGADALGRWFGPEVTEPVRLHVAAKHCLCAAEPEYRGRLSEASNTPWRSRAG
ncbi:HD domain-containing protein [Streptomyces sp. NPDC015171]|uniref:HD domain-containing protein n=1 Tax=Streptomyces sp. NPDC015171 TaxID=3364945 RepID=UPI003700525E